MKKILASLLFVGVLAACGDNTADDTNIESPSGTETTTDSTTIRNDSTAAADSLGINLGADDNNTYRDNKAGDTSNP
jgi:hypothetical protein